MRFLKYRYTIRIGAWTLAQWLRFTLVLIGVIGAATYISRKPKRDFVEQNEPQLSGTRQIDDREFEAEVVGVVDGDTLDISGPNGQQRIRLNGIDCPEMNQPFGNAARGLASDMALHRRFSIKVAGRDRYGRSLADLAFPDGRILNQELVRAGMAWWFQKYSNDTKLEALEREARQKRIGLWSDSEPIAPWDFRNRNVK